jgi:hypothetical protein
MNTLAIRTNYIDRHALVLATVTLDGRKARVTGIRNDFATVTDSATGMRVEFAWSTVDRVVRNGGAFKSN